MKILIIRFSSLGDIVLLSPVFRETKKIFPNAKIMFMTSGEFAAVHQNNPHLSQTFLIERQKGWREILRCRKFIRQEKIDIIFDAHCSLRSFLIRAFASAKIFKTIKRNYQRYSLIYWKKKIKNPLSQRAAYLHWLQNFSKEKREMQSEFFIDEKDKKTIRLLFQSYLISKKKLIVIAMGARYFNKCWPADYWLALIGQLKELHFEVVSVGTNADKKLFPRYKKIVKNCSLDLTGKLSLGETAALLSNALLLVCGDSAPLHLAEAVKTPVVSIFGPTTADFGFAPFLKNSQILEAQLPCKPCSAHGKKKCTNKVEKKCMKLITPDLVLERIKKMNI